MKTLKDRQGPGRTSGDWETPQGESAINSTGAGAADGTALVDTWVNEYIYYPLQKLFRLAGITPNHQNDTIDSSQIIQALLSANFNNLKALTFTEAAEHANIASGETLAVIMGKLMRAFTDIFVTYALGQTQPLTDDSQKTASTSYVKGSQAEFLKTIYPIGAIYMSVNSTNPGSLFTGTTWVAWGNGRVPVGVDTNNFNFSSVEKTGGASTHKLTISEMPSHTHKFTAAIQSGAVRETDPNDLNTCINNNITSEATGGGQEHNNLQPYITCYMWKRTA